MSDIYHINGSDIALTFVISVGSIEKYDNLDECYLNVAMTNYHHQFQFGDLEEAVIERDRLVAAWKEAKEKQANPLYAYNTDGGVMLTKAVSEVVIYLAVETKTGRIDYEYMSYMFREAPEEGGPYDLIEGWVWKPFKVTPKEE